VVTSITTEIPGSLSKIGKFLQKWIPKNIRTITTAYSKIITDLDTIKKQMDDVVKEMVEAKSKNQAVDISEFVKRLQDLAASGVKKRNSTFEGLWNEMVRDNTGEVRGVVDQTIDNALKLDYPKNKYEVIVVNDASTDGTRDVILKTIKIAVIKKIINKNTLFIWY